MATVAPPGSTQFPLPGQPAPRRSGQGGRVINPPTSYPNPNPPVSTQPVKPTKPTIPGFDPSGQSLGLIGPYGDYQAQAEKAYNDALAQINTNQATTFLNYGVGQSGQEIDPAQNPYGLEQQQQAQSAAMMNQIAAGLHSRGIFGGGIAGQAEATGQAAAGQAWQSLLNNLLGQETGFETGRTQAQNALTEAGINNQLGSISLAIQQGLLPTAASRRSDADVQKLVSTAAAWWAKKFGSLAATNASGQSFQQLLDTYGQKLYLPGQGLRFGGKLFGGA